MTVVVRDDQSNMSELEVLVSVTELNEGPEIQETPANTDITVSENSEGVLFDYSATDPEDPDTEITRWSVTGTDGGDFTINEDGELSFRNVPDFERPVDSNRDNEYLVTVRASDGRYNGTLEVTVRVEAENEAAGIQKRQHCHLRIPGEWDVQPVYLPRYGSGRKRCGLGPVGNRPWRF